MWPSAARVLPPPTVTSPATSLSAAATTQISAAASPKITRVWRGMASVCQRPNAIPSPDIGPPVWRAPTESAVYQGGHQMVAMGQVRAVAAEESTADAWVQVAVEADPDRVPVEAGPDRVPVEDDLGMVPVEDDPGKIISTAVGAMRAGAWGREGRWGHGGVGAVKGVGSWDRGGHGWGA